MRQSFPSFRGICRYPAVVFSLFLSAPSLHAEEIFTQDFENGLSQSEFVFGRFSVNDSHPVLGNGTKVMGHAEQYGDLNSAATPLPTYSYYEVDLDLRGFENAKLTFDLKGGIEKAFDGLNLLANTSAEFSPPDDLLEPTAESGIQYDEITIHAASSEEIGDTAWFSPNDPSEVVEVTGEFDLTAFDDKKVTVRFQFGTDAFEGGDGANIDNIRVEGDPLPDNDSDGMADSWEIANGLNSNLDDTAGDPDGDTLTNLQEFHLCTDPQKVDTDGDGLADNLENNSGTFVDATNPGTNPARSDTDRDGLVDGVETGTGVYVSPEDTGTDPHNPDTDGDGVSDGREVPVSDPNNASDIPSVLRGGGFFSTTHVWDAGTINDESTAEELTDPENEDGERITVDTPFIHFHDNAAPFAFLDESRPYPLFDEANGGDGFGENDDFAIRSVGEILIKPPGGMVSFIANSDDGFILRIAGDEIGTAGNRARANTLMEVELDAGLHELEFIHWERGGGAGVSLVVAREFGGDIDDYTAATSMEWELVQAAPVSDEAFQIERISLTENTATIAWPSSPGESFIIQSSPNLQDWTEVTDGHPSGGEETSFPVTVEVPNPAELYLRVLRE